MGARLVLCVGDVDEVFVALGLGLDDVVVGRAVIMNLSVMSNIFTEDSHSSQLCLLRRSR